MNLDTWGAQTFDCTGDPRIPGCRCINHRPDLYNSTMTITGATLCTAPTNTNGAYVVPIR